MSLTNEQLELNKRYVAALRSGDYKQRQNQLSDYPAKDGDIITERHCCLGVACEVANVPYQPDDEFPPDKVTKLYGWESENPFLKDNRYTATQLNDYLRYSFVQIADLFEAKYITGAE